MPSMSHAHDHLVRLLAWLADFEAAERRVHSQNGEDGVLEHLFGFVGAGPKNYIEFGVMSGRETNTRHLRKAHGWRGLMMDGGYRKPSINLQQEMVNVSNVVGLFRKYGFAPETELDLLSVDTDCYDYWLTETILSAGYRPRAIANEVNAALTLAPPAKISVPPPDDPRAGGRSRCFGSSEADRLSSWFGGSVSAFSSLYQRYNYSMVYCESTGVNCFGVRDDLLRPSGSHGAHTPPVSSFLTDAMVYRPARYGPNCGGHPRPHAPARENAMRSRPFVDVAEQPKAAFPYVRAPAREPRKPGERYPTAQCAEGLRGNLCAGVSWA